MLTKLQKRNSEGFTIIEVMIVLAIAALILLIVLLAVPALQRNSRNTTIKNDASSVAGGINTYESDNNGTPPTNVAGSGTVTLSKDTCSATAGTTAPVETIKVNGSTTVSCQAAAPGSTPTPGNVIVVPKLTCNGTASNRAFALYYATETSGSTAQQCLDT
jgi:prepilin-type N-terminal cleavage/methylation domain-containing protein